MSLADKLIALVSSYYATLAAQVARFSDARWRAKYVTVIFHIFHEYFGTAFELLRMYTAKKLEVRQVMTVAWNSVDLREGVAVYCRPLLSVKRSIIIFLALNYAQIMRTLFDYARIMKNANYAQNYAIT
jgi:hypothetical protein